MDTKIILKKQEKDEITKLFNWIKKSKKTVDLSKLTHNGHCNNYGSHCCLSCDKCWGGKYKLLK
jgi:hypothetical protein